MATPSVRILLYDNGGAFVDELALAGGVELSYQHGKPERAQITVERGHRLLDLGRLYPNGYPAYLEVDPVDYGLPVWLGQLEGLDIGSVATERQIVANGPVQWLGDEQIATVPGGLPSMQSGGALLHAAIEQLQTSIDLRIALGQPDYLGEPIEDELQGGTIWGLIERLESERAEEVYLDPLPRQCMLGLRVIPALGSRDQSGLVTLDDNLNCYWTSSIDLAGAATELAGIARSWDAADLSRGYSAYAPGGRVLGLRAALAAEIAGRTLAPTEGSSGRTVDPTSPTAAANRLRTITALRRALAPLYRAQVTITEQSLWQHIRTRDVLSSRFYEDDTGAYAEGLVKVRTLQYSLGQQLKCVASVDLWDTVVTL